MAILSGKSGAWDSVETLLRARNLGATHPRELAPLLEAAKRRLQEGTQPFYNALENELQQLEAKLKAQREQFAPNVIAHTKSLIAAIAQIDKNLEEYHSRPWVRKLLTFLTAFGLIREKRRLELQKEQKIRLLRQELLLRQNEYSFKQQNRERIIQQRFQEAAQDVTFLEQMLQSQELAGAVAELEVLDVLRTLPDSYHVCSDVQLKALRRIRFNGEYLQSAQIDYLVVGPTGVFVLEVKRWSRQFIEKGQFFDPYEQVARASYLCYDTLRSRLSTIRVQSVLVNCGALPPSHKDHRVKAVSLPELRRYLTWSGKSTLDSARAAEIVNVLCECH